MVWYFSEDFGTLPYLWANGRIALNTMGKYFLPEQSGKCIKIYNWWDWRRTVLSFYMTLNLIRIALVLLTMSNSKIWSDTKLERDSDDIECVHLHIFPQSHIYGWDGFDLGCTILHLCVFCEDTVLKRANCAWIYWCCFICSLSQNLKSEITKSEIQAKKK